MKKIICISVLSLVAACGGETMTVDSKPSPESQPSKFAECLTGAGITGSFDMKTTIKNGKTTQRIAAGNGVTEAQANKANACLDMDG